MVCTYNFIFNQYICEGGDDIWCPISLSKIREEKTAKAHILKPAQLLDKSWNGIPETKADNGRPPNPTHTHQPGKISSWAYVHLIVTRQDLRVLLVLLPNVPLIPSHNTMPCQIYHYLYLMHHFYMFLIAISLMVLYQPFQVQG